ncbi:hypothetical protein [Streptomyces kutzneri]|uniref:hypothetical protein n=1 Tax=Streptomyces kutzneri TaxID=3051179 RepID=UPI003F94A2F5
MRLVTGPRHRLRPRSLGRGRIRGPADWLAAADFTEMDRSRAEALIADALPAVPAVGALGDARAVFAHFLERTGLLRAPTVDTVQFRPPHLPGLPGGPGGPGRGQPRRADRARGRRPVGGRHRRGGRPGPPPRAHRDQLYGDEMVPPGLEERLKLRFPDAEIEPYDTVYEQ